MMQMSVLNLFYFPAVARDFRRANPYVYLKEQNIYFLGLPTNFT